MIKSSILACLRSLSLLTFFLALLCLEAYGQTKAHCGNKICESKETTKSCPTDCPKTSLNKNPFAVHAPGNNPTLLQELDVGARIIAAWRWVRPLAFAQLDALISHSQAEFVLTLSAAKKIYGPLVTGAEREHWKALLALIVERYDGDKDWGCLQKAPDCYKQSDRLYPKPTLHQGLWNNPVKYWQIENEWLSELKDPTRLHLPASAQDLLEYFIEVHDVIKSRANNAVIILGGFMTLQDAAGIDGYHAHPFFETGYPDYHYKKVFYKDLKGHAKHNIIKRRDAIEHLLVAGAPYYDIVDFHFYNNDPLELYYQTQWIRSILEAANISDKKIWSLEIAAPFYFFPLTGTAKPSEKPNLDPVHFAKYQKEVLQKFGDISKLKDNPQYDIKLHSSLLIKTFIIGLHAGIEKLFYGSLVPASFDNHCRLSLIDRAKQKKPAYYSYKLLTSKLSGYNQVEKLGDFIYKFSAKNRKALYIMWSDKEKGIIDLSAEIASNKVRVTELVVDWDRRNARESTILCSKIPLSTIPIIVESAI